MRQPLLTTLKNMYYFLVSAIVAAVLCCLTWYFWNLYQDASVQAAFAKEGKLVSLRVDKGSQKKRNWRDMLSNCTYLTTTYQGKTYETRFVMDSGYVGTGNRVSLLYHSGYDAFRQPGSVIRFERSGLKSRLLDWSTIQNFSTEHILLALCILLATFSFFLITGLIVTVVPVPFLQEIARYILVAELLAVSVFFTYDTWRYYQYYQHLKTTGHPVSVRVLDTSQRAYGGGADFPLYAYEASVRYQQQERIIPISEEEYESLKPNDSLDALYDESVNDLMSG